MASILFSTTKCEAPFSSSLIRCSFQICKSDLVTPVSAPKINTTASARGIRLTVNSGSAPMAFKPGVSNMIKPCLSSGWAILISAWRQRGTSTMPSACSGGLSSGVSSCQKPKARASSWLTRLISDTFSKACESWCASFTSKSTRVQVSGALRHSISAWGCKRVSIGSRRKQGGTEASQPNSVGHMVVRPALAGMMRWP